MFCFHSSLSWFSSKLIVHSSCDILTDSEVNKVGIKSAASIPCIKVDVAGAIFNLEKDGSDPSPDAVEDIYDSKGMNSVLEAEEQSNLISHENHHHFKIDILNCNELEKMDTSGEVSSPEMSQIDPSGSAYSVYLLFVRLEPKELI